MRLGLALAVGLLLPVGLSFVIVQAAADGLSDQYLHAERVSEPSADAYVLRAAEVALLPRAIQVALFDAARDGSADVTLDAGLRAAWTQLRLTAGRAGRLVFEVDGALVAMELRQGGSAIDEAVAWGEELTAHTARLARELPRRVAG